jgi:hypothetical protein
MTDVAVLMILMPCHKIDLSDVFKWLLSLCQEDIQLMADMGMDAYRFSIAWSRILPSKFLGTERTHDFRLILTAAAERIFFGFNSFFSYRCDASLILQLFSFVQMVLARSIRPASTTTTDLLMHCYRKVNRKTKILLL